LHIVGFKTGPVENSWLAASIVTSKHDLAVGLGFFQLSAHTCVSDYLRSLATDIHFENCMTNSCMFIALHVLQRLKFKGDLTE